MHPLPPKKSKKGNGKRIIALDRCMCSGPSGEVDLSVYAIKGWFMHLISQDISRISFLKDFNWSRATPCPGRMGTFGLNRCLRAEINTGSKCFLFLVVNEQKMIWQVNMVLDNHFPQLLNLLATFASHWHIFCLSLFTLLAIFVF